MVKRDFAITSQLLHNYFAITSQLLHNYFTITSQLLHNYFTKVTGDRFVSQLFDELRDAGYFAIVENATVLKHTKQGMVLKKINFKINQHLKTGKTLMSRI